MIFPCPHCKKSFGTEFGEPPIGDLKLQCPACGGIFVLRASISLQRDLVGANPQEEPQHTAPDMPNTLLNSISLILTAHGKEVAREHKGETTTKTATKPVSPVDDKASKKRWLRIVYLFLIVLLPVSGIFLASGIVTRHKTAPPSILPQAITTYAPTTTSINESIDTTLNQDTDSARAHQGRAIPLPLFPLEEGDVCQRISSVQDEILHRGGDTAQCQLFTVWIAYLVTESLSTTDCPLEEVFILASERARNHSLCANGYTFLAAYYIWKKMEDRSKAFLHEVRRLSPEDPWVSLVDARFSQLIDQDRQASMTSLRKSISIAPNFLYAHYLMAMMYIETEAYREARDELAVLQRLTVKGDAFQKSPGTRRNGKEPARGTKKNRLLPTG